MNVQAHLIGVLDELREYRARKTDYTLARAGGLLRQLLTDGNNTIVDRANEPHGLDIKFRTIDFRTKPPIAPERIQLHWSSLSAEGFPNAPTILCSRAEFLTAPLVMYEGVTISVRDAILAAANIKGGSHYGGARNDTEHAIEKLDKLWRVNGTAATVAALSGVAYVVLEALVPLERAIRTTPAGGADQSSAKSK